MAEMKFAELDARLRAFEREGDDCLPKQGFVVARLDGRGFTRLTKELLTLEKPFDARFHSAMSETLAHLFDCGFTLRFGYSQSDEISLLFASQGVPFERKTRKILSILAGEASAQFSLSLGARGVFDCRVSILPDINTARDYFRWRQLDAARNALSAHCYWIARAQGTSARLVTQRFAGSTLQEKREFLSANGVDFNALPLWQTRGFARYFETYEKVAINLKTTERVLARRKKLILNRDLPFGDDFANFFNEKLEN